MKNKSVKTDVRTLTRLAILSAIIIIMTFTPIGYLKIGPVDITFLMIPVAIGAIIIGPKGGLFLGAVFGLSSFITCFGISPFGAVILGINPILTFILCFVPRVVMGWLVGFIFEGLSKIDRTNTISFAVSSLLAALINTVLFVGMLVLFFGNNPQLQQFLGVGSVIAIIGVLITFNALIEAGVCLVVGGAISKALSHLYRHYVTKQ